MKEAAGQMLAAAVQHQRPATPSEVEDFVVTLGTIVANTLTAEEAKVKAKALAGLLDDIPVGVIKRKETLKRAGRAFKFLPTFQELDAFLTAESTRFRQGIKRLESVVDAPLALPAPPKPERPAFALRRQPKPSPDAKLLRDMSDDERAEFFARMREKYPGGMGLAESLVGRAEEDGRRKGMRRIGGGEGE